jgi:hypothetical protein
MSRVISDVLALIAASASGGNTGFGGSGLRAKRTLIWSGLAEDPTKYLI